VLLPPGGDPPAAAARLARWFAAVAYGPADGRPAAVTASPPRPVRVPGPGGPVDGTVTEVTAGAPPDGGSCAASGGAVLALAVPARGGTALLLVAADSGGGPPDPPALHRADLDAVVASARLR
jgi:hypothetical protein